MSDIRFNYHSARSQKARIAVKFSDTKIKLMSALSIFLALSGIAMIIFKIPLGWSLIGFSVIPAMIAEWYRGELHHLKLPKNIDSMDDILSGRVLGYLSENPSPQELATIVGVLPGGYFFAARFGIGAKFLQEISSNNPDDIQSVWNEAVRLLAKTDSKNVSDVILLVALVKCSPNYQSIINHLQLDYEDLIKGIEWYNYLRYLIEQHRQPKRTGGIARDWSFGWTPLLDRFGINVSGQISLHNTPLIQLAAHKESLEKLIDIFSKRGRQNAVLVGPLGAGKTEIVTAFASKLIDASSKIPNELKFRQVFILDAGSLIAAAPDRGGLENLVPRILSEAYNAKNIIICLDNAQLFFEEGIGSVDISNILIPILNAGNLRMILTMDDQQYLKISQRNPEIVKSVNKVIVEAADKDETISVMQDKAIVIEFENQVTFMYQAIQEAYRLGERYVYDLAMPGRALKILESAAHYSENGLVTAESVRKSLEKTMDIKVGTARSDDEKEKLLNLESLIHERMINQSRAVEVVSDAIRRARTGVRNQDKPIGTFLFLGPTGVGKTELAKSLAAVYFNGEENIIRLDMNEYVQSSDVKRLIADGSKNSNSLTASVIKKPFSVILLDEIEKAHPDVLSTLLQTLDEGVMRDEKNREVSFKDAIIIATSNARADRIREYIDRGYDISQFEDQFVDELISSNQFKPEFLNRFDEIVVFRPLNKSELMQVVDLMLVNVNKTLSLQKISVEVDVDAKKYLIEAGYNPRLGARPMRRVVQRAVESTVAKMMLSGTAESGQVIKLKLEDIKSIIDKKIAVDDMTATE